MLDPCKIGIARHKTDDELSSTSKESMSVRYFERITATQLADTLRSASAPRPLIIDVRDSDFAGGHIRSAVNLSEDKFISDDDVDAIVAKYRDEEMIVFHCMLSQVRGPSCARRFLNRMLVVLADQEKKPDVRVLTGGYHNFSSIYKDDADLIEL